MLRRRRMHLREFQSFEEFWPYYVGEHKKPLCRLLHYIGALAVLGILGWVLYSGDWMLLLALPIAGYGPAWIGHFFVEGNHPATWSYVGYSLMGEFKMFCYGMMGLMGREVERHHPS